MIRPGAVICRSMMLRYSPIYQLGGKQEENNMTPLEILWRNPYPVRARGRRRRFEREGQNSLYVLQEFV